MADNKIFRQAVLDRLASPEKLHTLMRITDAKGWIALIGCGLLVATVVVWGFVGRIPTKLAASGMLIHGGGLADVVAIGAGQVTALEVDVGDYVEEGDVVAHVAQPELRAEISSLQSRLLELQANYEKSKAAGGQVMNMRLQASSQAHRNLESAIEANHQRVKELKARLAKQEDLQDKGLLTAQVVEATRESLRTAEVSEETMRAQMERLKVDNLSAKQSSEAALMGESLVLQDTERQIKSLKEKLEQNSRVVSNHRGRVVEVRVMVGDLLIPGKPIVSLERTGDEHRLEALLYVDSRHGKIISPGMEVQISPTIVRKERYGVVIGTVKSVESFPSTRQGMMRVLHNEQLVDSFLKETSGTPIAVRATLTRDPSTPSGYKWSSREGPDMKLTSGTRCTADVTTRSQRPISLVLPALDLDGS